MITEPFIAGAVHVGGIWVGVAVADMRTLQIEEGGMRCNFEYMPRAGCAIIPAGRIELLGCRRVWSAGRADDIFNGAWAVGAKYWLKL